MSRASRPTRAIFALLSWAIFAAITVGIALLTTTEGVMADTYVVKLYRFIGNEQQTRVALSRLLNGLTVSTPYRPHLELLYAEIRDGVDSRWLFDKATRVLLRLGKTTDARRFMERWAKFDQSAGAQTRAIEIDRAENKHADALRRCKALPDEARRDPSLSLSCADVALAEGDPHLARDFTRIVRDNAASSPRPLVAAHLAARDADDAVSDSRFLVARDAVARGLRAIGTFDPATLPIELRSMVIRLLLADARLGHLDAAALARRLTLAVAVVEKNPALAGVSRELLAGALERHADVYNTVASSASALVKASPEFAAWWARTGLSTESANGVQLTAQRLETLARAPAPPRPFDLRFSTADFPDRIHNIGLFVPFGALLVLALGLSTRLSGFARVLFGLLAATTFATALETVQYFWIARRHADINDIWTAAVGAFLGGAIVVAFTRLTHLKRGPARK